MWANVRAGRVVQGGSTLTQQLVKNYFLSDEQTVGRKATEAVMAMRLEARYSKGHFGRLLERGVPRPGRRARHPRFRTRQRILFRKALGRARAGRLALLIGLVKGPSLYDPRKHPDRALARRNLVLKELGDAHLIDAPTAKRALASPLGLRPPGGTYVPAYIDLVRRHLKRDYAEADLAAAGLSVYQAWTSRRKPLRNARSPRICSVWTPARTSVTNIWKAP